MSEGGTASRDPRRPTSSIYRIDGDIVSIARVLHEAMDIPNRLRSHTTPE